MRKGKHFTMDLGSNPNYGRPGAPQGQNTLLIVVLIVIVSILYWTGVLNGIHATMPNLTGNSANSSINDSMTTRQMISTQFGQYAQDALKIANCESGMNPAAVNSQAVQGSYATGLFQILVPSTWDTTSYAAGDPKDAVTNTEAAYQIFQRDGYSWREWACASIVGL